MEISYNDGDNFIRNTVTVKCGGRKHPNLITRKVEVSDGLPVPIEDLMLDLRVDSEDEEQTLVRMQRGASAFLERRTAYVLIPGVYQLTLPGWWAGAIEVNRGPLRAVESVEYLQDATTWTPVDMTNFHVQTNDREFSMRALTTFNRPALWNEVGQVRLTFTAGFTVDEEESGFGVGPPLDDGLRTTLIMLVAHYYKNRELFAAGAMEAVEKGAEGILGAYRQYW